MQQLDGITRMFSEQLPQLLAALEKDLCKPRVEAISVDVECILAEIRFTQKRLRQWMSQKRVPTPIAIQPGVSKIQHEPLGVVLIIGPWNYPVQLTVLPLVGAIAAGNCAVVKPSEVAVETSHFLARELPKYVDPECVRVVEGAVPETTALLEQRWDHIFYTGNGVVGRVVLEAAAKHLTPVTLELGGKSPCIVDRDANIDVTARRLMFGKFFNAGQTCVAPDYLLAHRDIVDRLVNSMKKMVMKFYGEDPKQSDHFARIINKRHCQRLARLLENTEIVFGGDVDLDNRYIAPSVVTGISPEHPIMQEEIFGPILPMLPIENIDEAIEFVNDRPKPLALYIFSASRETHQKVLEQTTSGGVCVNHTMLHLLVSSLPFGGVGDSGIGAYHGRHSFETFSHERAILSKGFSLEPNLIYPPYTEKKEKWIRRLL
jgi:aldehyde dehydrogenase (NAD+)